MHIINLKLSSFVALAIVLGLAAIAGTLIWVVSQQEMPEPSGGVVVTRPLATSSEVAEDTSASSVQAWNTYRNEKYGFEVKYPQDWFSYVYKLQVFSQEAKVIFNIEFAPFPEIPSGGGTFGIKLSRRALTDEISWFKSILGSPTYNEESLFVDNIPATNINYEHNYSQEGKQHEEQRVRIFLSKDSTTFSIYGERVNSFNPEWAKFDQILSTFKFIP